MKTEVEFWLLKEFNQLNFKYYIESFYGIVNRYDIDELKVYQQQPSLTDERIEKIYSFIKSDKFKPLIAEYKKSRKELIEKANGFSYQSL